VRECRLWGLGVLRLNVFPHLDQGLRGCESQSRGTGIGVLGWPPGGSVKAVRAKRVAGHTEPASRKVRPGKGL
jgi:hypothetical protein